MRGASAETAMPSTSTTMPCASPSVSDIFLGERTGVTTSCVGGVGSTFKTPRSDPDWLSLIRR